PRFPTRRSSDLTVWRMSGLRVTCPVCTRRPPLRSVKVGVSASLDPARTVHTQGFLNSVELFNRTRDFPFHLVWTDDGASAHRARAAARQMIASGVDVVVGHFASDAAASALEMYQDSGTPVLLPAATL